MENRLTYTSDEGLPLTKDRAYIGWSQLSHTKLCMWGLCGKALGVSSWHRFVYLLRSGCAIGCTSADANEVSVVIFDEKSTATPQCFQCLIQAVEILAVCEAEKRQERFRNPS